MTVYITHLAFEFFKLFEVSQSKAQSIFFIIYFYILSEVEFYADSNTNKLFLDPGRTDRDVRLFVQLP